jgi:hypothetical protein
MGGSIAARGTCDACHREWPLTPSCIMGHLREARAEGYELDLTLRVCPDCLGDRKVCTGIRAAIRALIRRRSGTDPGKGLRLTVRDCEAPPEGRPPPID